MRIEVSENRITVGSNKHGYFFCNRFGFHSINFAAVISLKQIGTL
jgi:hypothetical protein